MTKPKDPTFQQQPAINQTESPKFSFSETTTTLMTPKQITELKEDFESMKKENEKLIL